MKSIAVVACCDTKADEVEYICKKIRESDIGSLVIDVSASPGFKSNARYKREDVVAEIGLNWDDLEDGPRHEILDFLCKGVSVLSARLYQENTFNGIISCGGLQGTTIGSAAMRALPIGVPKLLISTVATGQRMFEGIVGIKDVTVMPSISDFTGINSVSRRVINNGVAAIVGMVRDAGEIVRPSTSTVVGTTLMGATNEGVVNAVKILKDAGIEVVSFHSTGAGGKVMEHLIEAGVISATMDLTLHEVVYEYFGYGFGYGANNRLVEGAKKGIPMVICPGGIDFMCQWRGALFSDIEERKYSWHNSTLAHVKLKVAEVIDISRIIISRINMSKGRVVVVLPTLGFRSYTQQGEALYSPEVDKAIIETFANEVRKEIPIKYVDANFIDMECSRFMAQEMLTLLQG